MCDRIIQVLSDDELVSPLDASCRSGTLIIHFGKKHEQIIRTLQGKGVCFDSRSKGIRMSPHIYNSEAQIDALTGLIDNSR
jgi:kynureninase